MDSIFNILSLKDFDEPPEIKDLKKYILDNFNVSVGVQIRDKDIVIIVPNSSAAGSLRLSGPKIKRELDLDKRLTFRING
jgi:hypothetical protein